MGLGNFLIHLFGGFKGANGGGPIDAATPAPQPPVQAPSAAGPGLPNQGRPRPPSMVQTFPAFPDLTQTQPMAPFPMQSGQTQPLPTVRNPLPEATQPLRVTQPMIDPPWGHPDAHPDKTEPMLRPPAHRVRF